MTTRATISDFTCIESHPYGVLPGGNVYLEASSDQPTAAQRSLLPSDELWQQLLSFCDGASLGRFVQACRHFYVAGHQPELWRDLVLRDIQGSTLEQCGPTWKDTYVLRRIGMRKPHVPIPVRGVYSDLYYRTHLCRSFQIPDSWLQPTTTGVDRVHDLSTKDFLTKYEEANKPVVLAGVAKTWKALQKWTSIDYLAAITHGRDFRATSGAAPLPAQFTLQSYAQYSASAILEESPLYLFDRTALLIETPLHRDFYPDLQRTCPYFDPSRISENGHDLFSLLGEGARPDHTWLILGPQRSGSSFHMDPNATHAWNAAIVGRKRWIFYPPGVTPPGVHPSPNGDHVAMPISLGEWLLNYWEEHIERYKDIPSRRPMECTVEAGDVVFVPHGWWHMVINLDETNIAVTHNYAGKSNLATVLRFLEKKQDQISGCRDRKESVKPESLLSEFCKVLQERYPGWLDDAQQRAKEGWSCPAWTDDCSNDEPKKQKKKLFFLNGKRRRAKEESINSVMAKARTAESSDSPTATSGFSFSFL